eukprot:CAMPEP_0203757020 /NCGR_PEP_ID=MMETSP0098-20131031/10184_1 /ASSEMBLY_ACC=CAM_ASM_000208 /TAXON_ID=96639 /ORGANISM=" , Strain NY0313808BC1" /LENGTH=561 /DNA_ID=CAMNT_0050649109 /DNA_START=57 /DNA_END=1739 /DNA_ORIENTATION=-
MALCTLEQVGDVAARWMKTFQGIGPEDVMDLFDQLGGRTEWRDLMAMTGGLRSFHSEETIVNNWPRGKGPRNVKQYGEITVEGGEMILTFDFEMFDDYVCRGIAKFSVGEREIPGCWCLLTSLEAIRGFEERIGENRVRGDHMKLNLRELRDEQALDPEQVHVLIVGAGHSGLMMCARLKAMGINALVIDKNERIGDNWRKRYAGLVLHDRVNYTHMLYLPFPETAPTYQSKDKVADWLEMYAGALDLRVWNNTTIVPDSTTFSNGQWSVTLNRSGETVCLQPKHMILATGMSGAPLMPAIPGNFSGSLCHSSELDVQKIVETKSKRVVVVGTGNSGCDIAHMLCEQGCEVTLLQRSSTYVCSIESMDLLLGGYDKGRPIHQVDLEGASTPYLASLEAFRERRKQAAKQDAKMLEGLEKAGFHLNKGVNDGGIFFTYISRGGGYYMDVGAAELIANGRIKMRHGEISRFEENTLVLSDDSTIECDAVVCATGFSNMKETARNIFGSQVADETDQVWGLDDEGEIRGMWKRQGDMNFYYMGGNFHQVRHYSQYVAMDIVIND